MGQVLESISESANSSYYLFVAEHAPRANSSIPEVSEDLRSVSIEPYRNMIFGKRVTETDVALMVRRIPYVSNTAYAMYDDEDPLLAEKSYFVIVNEGSFSHVYKCLDNNRGAYSTETPQFSHVSGSNSAIYELADGYRWKYLYSVSGSQLNKFGTSDYFPVIANSEVQSIASRGSIDVIKIEETGRGYDNFVVGDLTSSDVQWTGNPLYVRVTNAVASSINNFYNGCVFYLSTGPKGGTYRIVTDYVVSGGTKYLVLDDVLAATVDDVFGGEGTISYQVYPRVVIEGDGSQSVNAFARAVVNSASGNSISRIELLERGAGYDYATASAYADPAVSVGADEEASLRVIASPPNGHGSDPAMELGSRNLCVSTSTSSSESNTIPYVNQFQQVGLLRDPLFNNVKLSFTKPSTIFIDGEEVVRVSPIRINTNVVVTELSTTVSCLNGDFENQLEVGDSVLFASGDAASQQITYVAAVTNSTYLEVSDTMLFTCSESMMYQPRESAFGFMVDSDVSFVTLDRVSGVFGVGDTVIGKSSGEMVTVEAVARADVTKGFDTFVQMYRHQVTDVSGTFIENELLYQGSVLAPSASGTLHSLLNTGGSIELYTSNQVGSFVVSTVGFDSYVYGKDSGARAKLVSIVPPEIEFGSGDVLYVENLSAVSRKAGQTETFKLVLEF
jgi:hypothetical protein